MNRPVREVTLEGAADIRLTSGRVLFRVLTPGPLALFPIAIPPSESVSPGLLPRLKNAPLPVEPRRLKGTKDDDQDRSRAAVQGFHSPGTGLCALEAWWFVSPSGFIPCPPGLRACAARPYAKKFRRGGGAEKRVDSCEPALASWPRSPAPGEKTTTCTHKNNSMARQA